MLRLSIVFAVDAILSCCLIGAWEDNCCVTAPTRFIADAIVLDDIAGSRRNERHEKGT